MATTSPSWATWTGVGLMLLGLTMMVAAGMLLLMVATYDVRFLGMNQTVQIYVFISGLAVGVSAFVVGWALTQVRPKA